MCVRIFASGPGLEGRGLLCLLHHSWAWTSSPLTPFLSPHALCRTYGLPTLEAATACPARAAALCSVLTRSQSTRRPRPFSCFLQVKCPSTWDFASTTLLAGLYLLFCVSHAQAPLPILCTTLHPSPLIMGFLVLFPTPISVFSFRSCFPFSIFSHPFYIHMSTALPPCLNFGIRVSGLCHHYCRGSLNTQFRRG